MQISQNKGKKAVLFLESQPPHLGELLQIINALQNYEQLFVCVNSNPIIMPVRQVLGIWNVALQPYIDNVKLVTFDANLQELAIDELPELFKDCVYLTSDRIAYVHLSSLNVIKVQLMPKVLGYCGIFLRSTYRQSRALTWLENNFLNPILRKK